MLCADRTPKLPASTPSLRMSSNHSIPHWYPRLSQHPAVWAPVNPTAAPSPEALSLGQAGPAQSVEPLRIPRSGQYHVWVEGSFLQPLSVRVGTRLVGSVSHDLGPPGQFTELGTIPLAAGDASLEVIRPSGGLGPLDYYPGDVLGPIVVTGSEAGSQLQQVTPAQADSLCGKQLGWVEIIR